MTVPIIDQYGLDAVIETYAKGEQVNAATLAWLDFETSPQPVWTGEYDITAGGQTWVGLGKAGFLITIDNLEAASTLDASSFKVTLSGVDAGLIAAAAGSDRADYVNRLLIVYALFCDKEWQPLANPMAIAGGFMGSMTTTRSYENNAWTRTVNLPVNNMFYGRGVSPFSFWSDADQQQRFAGDTGMQFIAQLQDFDIPLPWN